MKFIQAITAAALVLTGLGMSSPLESVAPAADAGTDVETLSGCDQGKCPDNALGFDLFGYYESGRWKYKIRWKGRCGCTEVKTNRDACVELDICTGKEKLCIDFVRGRAAWVDPSGHRTCYSIDDGYVCAEKSYWEAWPTAEVPCAW